MNSSVVEIDIFTFPTVDIWRMKKPSIWNILFYYIFFSSAQRFLTVFVDWIVSIERRGEDEWTRWRLLLFSIPFHIIIVLILFFVCKCVARVWWWRFLVSSQKYEFINNSGFIVICCVWGRSVDICFILVDRSFVNSGNTNFYFVISGVKDRVKFWVSPQMNGLTNFICFLLLHRYSVGEVGVFVSDFSTERSSEG